MVKVLILLAAGINCDLETEEAFKQAGALAKRVHVNDLLAAKEGLQDYHILVLPGGFSFGDDISSGQVLAKKLKYKFMGPIQEFIARGKLVLGICNGFQVMVKLGLLPGFEGNYQEQKATLTFNDSGKFEDRWVYLKINPKAPCVFTKGIEGLYLPIRHGEGKFVSQDEEVLEKLVEGNQVVAQYVDSKANFGGYPVNPNGSQRHIAGICDPTGRIFGLMPHPEVFVRKTQHPRWTRGDLKESDGLKIFKNAVAYVRENLV